MFEEHILHAVYSLIDVQDQNKKNKMYVIFCLNPILKIKSIISLKGFFKVFQIKKIKYMLLSI